MKLLRILTFVFLLIGLGLLTGAYFLYRSTSEFVASARVAQGKVVELARSRSDNSSTYAPVVRFRTQQGQEVEFRSSVSSNPPSYTAGETVEVLYRPDRPERAEINSFMPLWFGSVLTGFLGAVFLLVGAGMYLVPALRARNVAHLTQHGIAIQTRYQGVERNTSVSINGRHPYRVVSQWKNPTTGEIHVFTSGNLGYDPSAHITAETIKVFIERNNPRKYFMDLSFLPKMADDR